MHQASKRTLNFSYAIRDLIPYAKEVEALGHKVLPLNIGDPMKFDFAIPETMMEAVKEKMANSGPYAPSEGYPESLQAIADFYHSKPENILIGNGASELIANILGSFLSKGLEVLIPSPDYPLYTSYTRYFDGTPVHYNCDESNGWQPDPSDIESKITKNTRAIVIINPNNPTGATYSRKILTSIVALGEVYDHLIYDDKEHISTVSLSGNVPVYTLGSLSKNYLAPGWRAGWVVKHDPENKTEQIWHAVIKLSRARLSSNTLGQLAIPAALKLGKDHFNNLVGPEGKLTLRRKALLDGLEDIPGVSCVKPRGAFYAFPNVEAASPDDKKFVIDFLQEKHVLVVHGSGFSYTKKNHLRIVFLPPPEVITEACKKLREFIS